MEDSVLNKSLLFRSPRRPLPPLLPQISLIRNDILRSPLDKYSRSGRVLHDFPFKIATGDEIHIWFGRNLSPCCFREVSRRCTSLIASGLHLLPPLTFVYACVDLLAGSSIYCIRILIWSSTLASAAFNHVFLCWSVGSRLASSASVFSASVYWFGCN